MVAALSRSRHGPLSRSAARRKTARRVGVHGFVAGRGLEHRLDCGAPPVAVADRGHGHLGVEWTSAMDAIPIKPLPMHQRLLPEGVDRRPQWLTVKLPTGDGYSRL